MKPVCLITGSAGKLGLALCRVLAQTHHIAAVYRSQVPSVPSQLRVPLDIEAGGARAETPPTVYCIQGDLTKKEDVRRIVEVGLARFGQIDVVINSAADTRYHGKLLDVWFDAEASHHQLLTNCVAPMSLVSAIFQESWKNERAANQRFNRSVINVSSMSGVYVYPNVGQAFYSASKAALNFLTMHLAYELANYSVRANAICPSRFPDSIPTAKVVAEVRRVMQSQATGEVVEITG